MALTYMTDLANGEVDNGNFARYNTLFALGSSRNASEEIEYQDLRTTLISSLFTAQRYNDLIDEFGVLKDTILTQLEQDILLLMGTIERLNAGQQFANLTGYGAFTIFNSNTDESIDFINTTATINTTEQTCTWDDSGTEFLSMADIVRENNFNSITLRIFSDELNKATVETVTDDSNIVVTSDGYNLTTNDSLIINNTEVGINSISGGVADTTYLTEIENSNNNNRGKNNVFFNGFRHTVVSEATGLKLYRMDDATNKVLTATISTDITTAFSITVANVSGNEFLYVTWGTTTLHKIKGYDTDYTVVQAETTVDSVTTLTDVDIANQTDKIGVINRSKVPTYASYFNYRGTEYTIGVDGSLTLDRAVEQITLLTIENVDNMYCFYQSTYLSIALTDPTVIIYLIRNNTLGTNAIFNANWTFKQAIIVAGTKFVTARTKTQGSNLGRMFIAYSVGTSSLFSYSDDNGANWSSTVSLGTGSKPQISENSNGDIHFTYEDSGAIKTIEIPDGTVVPSTSITRVASGASNPKTDGQATDYIVPVFSYQDSTSVKIGGQELIGAGFNVELASPQPSISVSDELIISTQFAPLQTTTPIPFKSQNSNYIEYQITGLDTNTTDIIIGNTENEVVSNLITWNAI